MNRHARYYDPDYWFARRRGVCEVGSAIGIVAGSFIGDAVATAVVGTVVGDFVGSALIGKAVGALASSVIGGVINSAISGGRGQAGNVAAPVTAAAAQGIMLNSTSNVASIPVIYGSRRAGGNLVFIGTSGANNEILHLVIVLCEGQIDSIPTVYINDLPSSDAKYASSISYLNKYVGTDTQAADPNLIAALPGKWTSAHQLKGCAYIAIGLVYDQSVFPNGQPTITADVNGKLVYDVRDATTKFSNNPILCINDYQLNTRYGMGIPLAEIDTVADSAMANHCDTTTSIPNGSGGTTTQVLYTCDGVVDTAQKPIDNLRSLLSSVFRGKRVFSGGKYRVHIDKVETPTTDAFNEDNICGAWQIIGQAKSQRLNQCKAKFFNPVRNWQPDLAIYDNTAYRTIDSGSLLELDIDLPFTANYYRAQRLANLTVNQSRFSVMAKFTATIAGLRAEVGDVKPITHTTPGWSAKNFRISALKLLSSDEVEVTVLEYQAATYTPDGQTSAPIQPATNLPNPGVVGTPGPLAVSESLYQTSGSAGVKSRAMVTWTAPADAYVQQYQLEYKLSSVGVWSVLPIRTGVTATLDDLAPGVYNFRLKAINTIGVSSSYTPTLTQELYGLNAPPSNPTNFAVQSYSGQAKFTWTKPTANNDLDVVIGGRAFIRWSPLTVAATWDHGSLVNPDGYPGDTSIGFGPLMTGTYLIKFRDSSGNYSVTEASFVVTEALITGLTTIATVTESPTFTGTKSNVAAIDGGIQLDGSTLIDSMLTLMDSWGSIDSLGGIQATGTYSFSSKMDLGSVTPARLFSTIGSLAFDSDDLIDSRTNLMDDWGLFDGAVIEDVEAQLMVRVTNDDPNAVPAWGPWHALGLVADYNNRGFDFRLDFASGNATHNRSVTSLSVAAKH